MSEKDKRRDHADDSFSSADDSKADAISRAFRKHAKKKSDDSPKKPAQKEGKK